MSIDFDLRPNADWTNHTDPDARSTPGGPRVPKGFGNPVAVGHGYLRFKRAVDLLFLTIFAPLIALIAFAVGLTIALADGRPVLFRQSRIGRHGQPFDMFKFRTMRSGENCVDAFEAACTKTDDCRITRLGRFLRKTRLDELPQIVNIARGEMSWIGPRPEARILGEAYEREIASYCARYRVRPGITGWAQVNQGHVTGDEEMRVKLRHDLYYVENISFGLDFMIALRTIPVVLTGWGAR